MLYCYCHCHCCHYHYFTWLRCAHSFFLLGAWVCWVLCVRFMVFLSLSRWWVLFHGCIQQSSVPKIVFCCNFWHSFQARFSSPTSVFIDFVIFVACLLLCPSRKLGNWQVQIETRLNWARYGCLLFVVGHNDSHHNSGHHCCFCCLTNHQEADKQQQ